MRSEETQHHVPARIGPVSLRADFLVFINALMIVEETVDCMIYSFSVTVDLMIDKTPLVKKAWQIIHLYDYRWIVC